MYIHRTITKKIESVLFKKKVIIIYGARQVGKTTLIKYILEKYGSSYDYYSADDNSIVTLFSQHEINHLGKIVQGKKIIVIDEAQRIPNIGLTLKILVDHYPETQIIASGSSSFDLANTINEPLTGRNFTFELFPYSYKELEQENNRHALMNYYAQGMIYGHYPEIVMVGNTERELLLKQLANNYLYKDILSFSSIRKPDMVIKLLQALALQIGNEVSYTELAGLLGIDKITVEQYIYILEQAFIIFRLSSLSRNLRNELKKSRKIYFRDLGMRNALINNFNSLSLRNDVGAMRENYVIAERQKNIKNSGFDKNTYFWRTHQGHEIDYIEEGGGVLDCYEIKRSKQQKVKIPILFEKTYTNTHFTVIHKENYCDFVMGGENSV